MIDEGDDHEETVVVSRRDRRRLDAQTDAAAAGSHEIPRAASSTDEPELDGATVDDATVVVVRGRRAGANADDSADADDGLHEETVVVDRTRRAYAEPVAKPVAELDEFADEATVIVHRSRAGDQSSDASIDEATVAVSRRPRPADERMGHDADDQDDDPAVRQEDPSADDSTVVVDRSARDAPPLVGEETVVVGRPARRLRRRRNTADGSLLAPAPAGPKRTASFAPPTDGPLPSIYKPRPAPLVPTAPPAVGGAPGPTRVDDPALPSVARQAVRRSRFTLLAVAGACVVSVTGLAGLAFAVFG